MPHLFFKATTAQVLKFHVSDLFLPLVIGLICTPPHEFAVHVQNDVVSSRTDLIFSPFGSSGHLVNVHVSKLYVAVVHFFR